MGYEINFKCFQWVIGAISDRFLTNQGVPNISVMLLMFSDIRTSLFFFLFTSGILRRPQPNAHFYRNKERSKLFGIEFCPQASML